MPHTFPLFLSALNTKARWLMPLYDVFVLPHPPFSLFIALKFSRSGALTVGKLA